MRGLVLANVPPVSHLGSLGLTQLRAYHLTEMTQWQLDCDQDIFSVNSQMLEQKSSVFAGHEHAQCLFLGVSVLQHFTTLVK